MRGVSTRHATGWRTHALRVRAGAIPATQLTRRHRCHGLLRARYPTHYVSNIRDTCQVTRVSEGGSVVAHRCTCVYCAGWWRACGWRVATRRWYARVVASSPSCCSPASSCVISSRLRSCSAPRIYCALYNGTIIQNAISDIFNGCGYKYR